MNARIALIVVAVLFALPFVDRNPSRSLRRLPAAAAFGSVTVLGLAGLYLFAMLTEKQAATAPNAGTPQVADRRGTVRFRVHVEYTSVAGTNRARDVVFEVTTERDDTGWHAPRATIVDGWR